MKNVRKLFALALAVVVVAGFTPMMNTQAATGKVNTTKYTISKKAGTYKDKVTIKIKAKKGYKIYYTTGSKKLTTKKVIKSGKTKKLTFTKTTKLKIYAVKSSKKVTNRKLKTTKVKKATKTYKYTIKKSSSTTDSSSSTSDDTTTDDTTTDDTETDDITTDDTTGTTENYLTVGTITESVDLESVADTTDDNMTIATSDEIRTITITAAGTYELTGGSLSNPLTGIEITSDVEVTLVLNDLYIDNSSFEGNNPVIQTSANTTIVLRGDSIIKGYGTYTNTSEPASGVIYQSAKKYSLILGADIEDKDASLSVIDAIDVTTDFGDYDPTDGITTKGGLTINSGAISITSNGDCLKGTNSGITVAGGELTLTSNLGGALKSKSSNITITDGTITTNGTYDDGINAKSGTATISGGTVTISNCYGDGIQAENVDISGGTINIETLYQYAATNFYASNSISSTANALSESGDTKTETINYDTGSHKGIKAGTKAKTYSYTSVEDGSDYTAGTQYTKEASGSLTISGGTITIDTTQTGVKANSLSTSGYSATGTGVYIIGSPECAIQANNSGSISGGTLTLAAADEGITAANDLSISGDTMVKVTTAYEGIEAKAITIGNGSDSPQVRVYSNDDGINASSKTLVYTYEDETEETYVKKSTSQDGNSLTINSGYVNVTIGADQTHSVTVPNGSSTKTITYSSDGDGLDCNGSLYIYGGTTIVYGVGASTSNSPIDKDDDFVLESGATVLTLGSSSMQGDGTPTTVNQAYISSSSQTGGPGSSGHGGQSSSSVSISSGAAVAILSGSTTLIAVKAPMSASSVFYSSPSLTNGSSYTLSTGGTLSSQYTDYTYDYYNGYTGGTSSTSLTAKQ
ncbi:carbohydrate-binding domain-containing protein [Eubacterium oxidoreducens]|uniref:Carbohydrate-binding domain-containing protein n=1 Tax=Eubacterium oxidoreducens TaxID=1732 RepID=A0A1G6CIU2_EUBOX|nr:carbohydrate-binding domain-containing protein [Eubacterium oxidoreducens]SDB32766.1 protein of unknown function [Eubacterium oxidoreducens]